MTGERNINALRRIEENMSRVEEGSLRHRILSSAKNFKSSWIELAQCLAAVQRDKLYKEWGFLTFEAYCAKEIGIRRETGLKLLRSYYFLAREEPVYAGRDYLDRAEASKIPSYETVDILRQAKNNKQLDIAEYERIKREAFESGKQDKQIRDIYRGMLLTLQEDEPEEARSKRRAAYVRRMVGTLRALKKEIEINKLLSGKVVGEIERLIGKIENELE